jgi:hypothetical protein
MAIEEYASVFYSTKILEILFKIPKGYDLIDQKTISA